MGGMSEQTVWRFLHNYRTKHNIKMSLRYKREEYYEIGI